MPDRDARADARTPEEAAELEAAERTASPDRNPNQGPWPVSRKPPPSPEEQRRRILGKEAPDTDTPP